MASRCSADDDFRFMSRALQLAKQGRGRVEPNPMVGCVIVREGVVLGEGWHQRFGGPHAEVEAIASADESLQGAEVFVTLEPCCHQGKTAACTEALICAKVGRVILGCRDPNPQVAGRGAQLLRDAGIEVTEDVCHAEARALIAPFEKLMTRRRPWVIAKWAMTLDGKIASHTGSSQWISSESSRAVVHRLRGQVDAILIGSGTAAADNPRLTARPPGVRTAVRVVLDSQASLALDSRLFQSVGEAPVLVAVAEEAPSERCEQLRQRGAEVVALPGANFHDRLAALLDELGRRELTNVLVEGGATVLGTLHDLHEIDEVHAFVAPKLLGGLTAPSAFAGNGIANMEDALALESVCVETVGHDWHVHGRVR